MGTADTEAMITVMMAMATKGVMATKVVMAGKMATEAVRVNIA
jgi:hypothetical protein